MSETSATPGYSKAEVEFSTGNIWSRLDQPPRKKYRDLKDRVGRAVSLYLSANILQFLQSMADLSHQ